MEYSAIRHIGDREHCMALDNGKFLIRLQSRRNDLKCVKINIRDKNIPVDLLDTRQSIEMYVAASDGLLDYYEAVIETDMECFAYCFEITDNEGCTAYYGNCEFYGKAPEHTDGMFIVSRILREEERHIIPDWAPGSVVYQIFVSRFATSVHVEEREWYKAPVSFRDNLHGDLKGIIYALDYLNDLGADVIYLTPVFKSPSSHKYDTDDYYTIDPEFGTAEDLKRLVCKAHGYGMKVILDGVFNHTSTRFFAFEDIKRNGFDSKYINWYYIDRFPVEYGDDHTKPGFRSFSYYGGMPKLNLNNEETADYFIKVGCYWIKECDIDGWRLDVADEINHNFWKKFRKAVRQCRPDVLLVGEDWQRGYDYLDGDEWDSLMNYSFYRIIGDFVARESITPTEFLERMCNIRGYFGPVVYSLLWNIIDSHDTERFRHMCGDDIRKLRLAAAIQLLTPGMPFIYYGDEQGMTGGPDPDCRRGMLWGDEYRDSDTHDLYKRLITIRKEHRCITEGRITETAGYDDEGVAVITREYGDDRLTLVFNAADRTGRVCGTEGRLNLLTGCVSDGTVGPYEALILK